MPSSDPILITHCLISMSYTAGVYAKYLLAGRRQQCYLLPANVDIIDMYVTYVQQQISIRYFPARRSNRILLAGSLSMSPVSSEESIR